MFFKYLQYHISTHRLYYTYERFQLKLYDNTIKHIVFVNTIATRYTNITVKRYIDYDFCITLMNHNTYTRKSNSFLLLHHILIHARTYTCQNVTDV